MLPAARSVHEIYSLHYSSSCTAEYVLQKLAYRTLTTFEFRKAFQHTSRPLRASARATANPTTPAPATMQSTLSMYGADLLCALSTPPTRLATLAKMHRG